MRGVRHVRGGLLYYCHHYKLLGAQPHALLALQLPPNPRTLCFQQAKCHLCTVPDGCTCEHTLESQPACRSDAVQ